MMTEERIGLALAMLFLWVAWYDGTLTRFKSRLGRVFDQKWLEHIKSSDARQVDPLPGSLTPPSPPPSPPPPPQQQDIGSCCNQLPDYIPSTFVTPRPVFRPVETKSSLSLPARASARKPQPPLPTLDMERKYRTAYWSRNCAFVPSWAKPLPQSGPKAEEKPRAASTALASSGPTEASGVTVAVSFSTAPSTESPTTIPWGRKSPGSERQKRFCPGHRWSPMSSAGRRHRLRSSGLVRLPVQPVQAPAPVQAQAHGLVNDPMDIDAPSMPVPTQVPAPQVIGWDPMDVDPAPTPAPAPVAIGGDPMDIDPTPTPAPAPVALGGDPMDVDPHPAVAATIAQLSGLTLAVPPAVQSQAPVLAQAPPTQSQAPVPAWAPVQSQAPVPAPAPVRTRVPLPPPATVRTRAVVLAPGQLRMV